MKDVTLTLSEDKLDLTINFHFEANAYFEQTLLTKTYVYDPTSYEPTKASSTVPTWNDGKNPAIKTKTKKIKSKFFFTQIFFSKSNYRKIIY